MNFALPPFCTEDITERHLSSRLYCINETELKLSDIKTKFPERNAKEEEEEEEVENRAR